MSNKTGKGLLTLSRKVGIRVAITMLLVFALSPMNGCTPDIPNDFKGYAVMAFDTNVTPPIIPSPNSMAIDPTTGMISLSGAGITVPTGDCTTQTEVPGLPVAACEFYKYLTSLDGFPTVMGAYAPIDASALAPNTGEVDIATVNADGDSRTLFVASMDRGDATSNIFTQAELITASEGEGAAWKLDVFQKDGWDVNKNYYIVVRGLENGIKTKDGSEFAASVVYFLLKKTESLTCGVTTGDSRAECESDLKLVSEDCGFYSLIKEAAVSDSPLDISYSMCLLEYMRKQMAPLWTIIDSVGHIPKEEVVIAWTFPTHSASVAQIDPSQGIEPIPEGNTVIKIGVKGTVNADTLIGNIILIDLTDFLTLPTQFCALMNFTPTFIDGNIVLSDIDYSNSCSSDYGTNLTSGHLYGIFMKNGITNTSDIPLVPSPLTVLLKSNGEIHDGDHSTIQGFVDDNDAKTIEGNRLALKLILDNDMLKPMLPREELVYIYAFTFTPSP